MASLAVFAKPPRAGLVKTRLIPDLGAETAARVYHHCLQHVLDVARKSGHDYRVYLSEPDDNPLFESHPVQYQTGNDLGERMQNALQEMLHLNPDGAIIVGSDCLDLEVGHLDAAVQSLIDHELVLMPAVDGGYALIGCRVISAALFEEVDWSTASATVA